MMPCKFIFGMSQWKPECTLSLNMSFRLYSNIEKEERDITRHP